MMKVFYGFAIFTTVVLTGCAENKTGASADLFAVPSEYAGETNPLSADAAVVGAKVYALNCESCHGLYGHGDGPASGALEPAPKNLAELQTQVGDDYLYWRVNTGKEGTSMVAWKSVLTDEQIWQSIAFIRTLK